MATERGVRRGEGARFSRPDLGEATPYGVCDLSEVKGWASMDTDHDAPPFAIEGRTPPAEEYGSQALLRCRESSIIADGGQQWQSLPAPETGPAGVGDTTADAKLRLKPAKFHGHCSHAFLPARNTT